jgi:hypothetical protein
MICRLCKGYNVTDVIELGNQIITSRFPTYGDFTTPSTPICLVLCKDCGLVQLKEGVSGSELYEHTYGYRSGINGMMMKHLNDYNNQICDKIILKDGDSVLDIGSNDATFLKYYPNTLNRVGCDPTGKQFASYYDNITLVPTYFTTDAVSHLGVKFKVVSSISMFYDLPDPVQFAKDIYNVLDDEGIWTLEQSYIVTMLERNSIDTICHEHIEYYSLTQIKHIMDIVGFKIIDVCQNDCNGGSFRIYVAKKASSYVEASSAIREMLENEHKLDLKNPDTYKHFMESCDIEISKLKDFLKDHPNTYIYGASTKGNCLLQYADITEKDIRYAVERNLDKVGKMTCTGIEIISEDTMRSNPPECLLVLPWHFKEDIIKREHEFLNNGGTLLFPFPVFQIIKYNS